MQRWNTVAAVLVVFISGTVVGSQIVIRQQAPTNRAAGFSLADLDTIVADMDVEHRTTVRLLEGGSTTLTSGESVTAKPL